MALANRARSPREPDNGSRELRIDAVRGLAVAVMVVNHLPGWSWIHVFTFGKLYVTAAEVFVICSGLVIGLVTRRRFDQSSFWLAIWPVLRRAAMLYLTSVGLFLVFGTLATWWPGGAEPIFSAPPASGLALLLPALTLSLAPPLIDILPLYVSCLLAVPLVVTALAWRQSWLVAAVSGALWLLNWLYPYALSSMPLDRGRPYFAFASWQVLFVAGFLIGWHRQRLIVLWRRSQPVGWLLSCSVVTLGLAIAAVNDPQLGEWPTLAPGRPEWLAATDRSLLGPVRLLAVASLVPLVFYAMTAAWQPLKRPISLYLVPLGQQSLFAYLVHIPLVVLWTAFVAPNLNNTVWLTTIGQGLVLCAVWWLAVRWAQRKQRARTQ